MEETFPEKDDLIFKDSIEEIKILRAVIEKLSIAVSIGDRNHRHLFHNPSFTKMFGHQVEDIKGFSFEAFYADPDTYKEVMSAMVQTDAWCGEIMMQDINGGIFPVLMHSQIIKDSSGEIVACLGSYTNNSENKKKEKEAAYQQEYLSTLHSISLGMFRRLNLSDLLNAIMVRASRLTQIPNGFLYLYDPNANELEIKAACGNLSGAIGYKLKPGKGFAWTLFEGGEPMILDNYQNWPEKIEGAGLDNIYAIVGIPLISGSKVEGAIGLCHDKEEATIDPDIISILEEFAAIAQIAIDNAKLFDNQKKEFEKRIQLEKERKEMETRLDQSQRMESIGTLAGGIAHDFNNILSSIMGFTQIAQMEAERGSALEDDLNEIYTASLRARDLVQQILTFARQSDDHASTIKISLIVKEVLKFIRSSIPSTITIEQDIASKSKVMANPTQVYQVFLNLFTNAAQAMENEGGILTVSLKDEILETDRGSIPSGEYIRADISDTGIGIDKDHLHVIFDPYFTTKEIGEGTGLGLSVVHGAIKSMGGEIFVESRQGEGTRFTFYLPVIQNLEEESIPILKKEILPQGKVEHILFVDDEMPITKVGKRILESQNYRVTTFTKSVDALECFRSNPDEFNVVVTDMTMPDMTGEKLAIELKKIRPAIPVILCTGHHEYASDKDFKDKGIDFICSKPISKEKLAKTVRSAIDKI